ncbi:MAG: hypothetical protein Q7J80_16780 [Anaerolineales bacterium]|nr:hypothetical protein [Anaerolineales bacterium]
MEVDQSGKIGDTQVPTVLAFSNGKRYSVLIPATVKRKCIQWLRSKGKVKLETRVYIKLFSVGVYLLLRKQIKTLEQVIIDIEYPGHEVKIKEHLLNLFQRTNIRIHPSKLQFNLVGKKSNAHDTAIKTFRGIIKPNQVITLDEILKEFRK